MRAAFITIRPCLLTLILAAAAGCETEDAHAPAPLPVTVWTVVGSPDGGGNRYSANIRPDVQVDLAFKVGGYVDEILHVPGPDHRRRRVQEGDFVRRGTQLARVRDSEYRDRVTEAQASLTRTRADFNRAARLFENQSIAKADYDASSAALTGAQARHDQAVETLGDARLVAPMDGWVLKRSIEVGTLVGAGSPGFVIADTRAVKAVFGVPDVSVGEVRMGDEQVVTSEALPGVEWKGRVTRIAPSADPGSRVFEVECTIPNADNRLKAGMVVALELAVHAAAPALILVPLDTVVRPRGASDGYAVFVVTEADGRTVAHERRITLGDVVENSVAVRDGLSGGERIIVRGATLALDGGVVRIIP